MKKFILAAVFLLAASNANAALIGGGFNNGAPTVRAWWNESLGSELSLSMNFYNDSNDYSYGEEITSARLTLTLTPVMWAFMRGEWGNMSLGAKLRATLAYNDHFSNVWVSGMRHFFRVHEYAVLFMLPEIEINVPYLKGLCLIGALGFSVNWSYEDNGDYSAISFSLFGPSVASLGLVYYFGELEKPKPAPVAEQAPLGGAVPGHVSKTSK